LTNRSIASRNFCSSKVDQEEDVFFGKGEAFAFVEVDVADEIGFVDLILVFFGVSGMESGLRGRLGAIVIGDLGAIYVKGLEL